jgi:hypothetical protein
MRLSVTATEIAASKRAAKVAQDLVAQDMVAQDMRTRIFIPAPRLLPPTGQASDTLCSTMAAPIGAA